MAYDSNGDNCNATVQRFALIYWEMNAHDERNEYWENKV